MIDSVFALRNMFHSKYPGEEECKGSVAGGGWVSLGGVEKYLPSGERSAGGRGGQGARQGGVSGPTAKWLGERHVAWQAGSEGLAIICSYCQQK